MSSLLQVHRHPGSARAGFLKYQIDLAWIYIWLLSKIGGVSSYRNSRPDFLKKYIEDGTARYMIPPRGKVYTSQHLHGIKSDEMFLQNGEPDASSSKRSSRRKQNSA